LEISFSTKKFEKECNDYGLLVRKYGDQCAKLIRRRLDELRDVETLHDMRRLPQARCHELTEDRKGQLAVDLKHPRRLIIEPNHSPPPSKPDGGLDWKEVTKIIAVNVKDYHG